jgi:hypothetical protein
VAVGVAMGLPSKNENILKSVTIDGTLCKLLIIDVINWLVAQTSLPIPKMLLIII